MYRKSVQVIRLERKRERCARMRAAKERKRLNVAGSVDVIDVGSVVFDGPVFGGRHEMRIRVRSGADILLVNCDGRELRPRTMRGFVAMLGRFVWKKARRTP